jgi:hypothetical protein
MNQPLIEKNVVLKSLWPFAKMEVGDSFVVPDYAKRASVYIAAKRFGDKHGMKFATRKTPEGSYRIWRTE